jgi:hypothetical protein
MLAHPKIVVRIPDCHFAMYAVIVGTGEKATAPFEVTKVTIAAFVM